MGSELKDKKKLGLKRLMFSFRYASQGILYAIKNEPNMKIHMIMMILVIVAGILFQINVIEWLICFLLFGLVIGSELINTSIETLVDLVCKDHNMIAKTAKDTAAGAVMVFAFFSFLAGIIIFFPKLFVFIERVLS